MTWGTECFSVLAERVSLHWARELNIKLLFRPYLSYTSGISPKVPKLFKTLLIHTSTPNHNYREYSLGSKRMKYEIAHLDVETPVNDNAILLNTILVNLHTVGVFLPEWDVATLPSLHYLITIARFGLIPRQSNIDRPVGIDQSRLPSFQYRILIGESGFQRGDRVLRSTSPAVCYNSMWNGSQSSKYLL